MRLLFSTALRKGKAPTAQLALLPSKADPAVKRWQRTDKYLRDQFMPKGAPAPGEKGYRAPPVRAALAYGGSTPDELATDLLASARQRLRSPGFAALWQGHEHMGFTPDDIPDLLGVPYQDGKGDDVDDDWRQNLASGVVRMAMEGDPEMWQGDNMGMRAPRAGGAMPGWLTHGLLVDALEPDRKLRLVNVDLDEATAFIAKHHSMLPDINLKGLMYAIGIRKGGRLVAVATAGTPTGPWNDPHNVLELTRVASDGTTLGAASKLTARLIDLLPKSGRGGKEPPKLVTYQFTSESGTTYRALREKGLRPTKYLKGKKPGGARSGSEAGRPTEDKIRWEAGPGAAPAMWSLLQKGSAVVFRFRGA